MIDFAASSRAYETALREAFGSDVDEEGLALKHARMAESPFLFLRATCWRWAEGARDLVPEGFDAPEVGSVGDAHAGNFGLWRDAHARLIWGLNDFDEAARLPWTLDLIRLAASLVLAGAGGARDVADALLAGYRKGLGNPKSCVLEPGKLWLRKAFLSSEDDRTAFWSKIADAPAVAAGPPYEAALREPWPAGAPFTTSIRRAGAGSLGRPRFVAYCRYRGGPLAYEVKGQMPSCWADGRVAGLAAALSHSGTRSPDPSQAYREKLSLRRLGADSRKLKFKKIESALGGDLMRAMAADLAAVHAGGEPASDIAHDLAARSRGWLAEAAERVARWTSNEHDIFKRSGGR